VRLGIAADDVQIALGRDRLAQVAVAQLVSGEHGMGVRVDEAGHQRAAVEVDRLRAAER
jgi:hypothetical protein